MELAKVLHMNGGAGDASYADNSLLQIEEKDVKDSTPISSLLEIQAT
ncbi:putative methyltransferase [Medicago truncatula]|uniref:Putative methyltransferase n=1 Tax=Medicago truncatula TaxID=3880 RepID=A0A396GTY4_MEDTR|nr:putative methyltransferase [Medicago truncatula]